MNKKFIPGIAGIVVGLSITGSSFTLDKPQGSPNVQRVKDINSTLDAQLREAGSEGVAIDQEGISLIEERDNIVKLESYPTELEEYADAKFNFTVRFGGLFVLGLALYAISGRYLIPRPNPISGELEYRWKTSGQ